MSYMYHIDAYGGEARLRLNSYCLAAMKIHISKSTNDILCEVGGFVTSLRGEVEVKVGFVYSQQARTTLCSHSVPNAFIIFPHISLTAKHPASRVSAQTRQQSPFSATG